MSPKPLLAFGAGCLFGGALLFVAARPTPPIAPPAVILPVQGAPAPEPAAVPESVPEPVKVQAAPRKMAVIKKTPRAFRPLKAERAALSLDAAIALDEPLPEVAADDPDPLIAQIGTADLPAPPPQTLTVAAGTLIQVRLGERLASDRNVAGDTFQATLDQPLVVDGWVIAERGARVFGHVTDVDAAGRIQGIATMTLELSSLTTSDGQKIPLKTARFVRKGDTSRKADAIKVGIGAVLGATIGASASGGKGAAIGAAAGGAAGAAAVAMSRGNAAALDVETRIGFRLDQPVSITERR
ncbi:MAG: hypothetical protein ABI811_20130 [Acidobacteriota bacterium]